MAREDWNELVERLVRRLIRLLDVVSILIFDAVILLVGYAIIWAVEAAAVTEDEYFAAAKVVCHVGFVIIYIAWVAWDLWEFVRNT